MLLIIQSEVSLMKFNKIQWISNKDDLKIKKCSVFVRIRSSISNTQNLNKAWTKVKIQFEIYEFKFFLFRIEFTCHDEIL